MFHTCTFFFQAEDGIRYTAVTGVQTCALPIYFKGKEASLLEDVKITIFGKKGERHDTIHTQSCQYEKAGESMACSGEVQMDLQSREEAERGAKNPEIDRKSVV